MFKNMKLRIFILLIITGVFTSCENYLDVNTDPNNPTAVPVKGLMSVASIRTASNTASMGYHTSYFVQYLAGPNAGGNTDTHQEINANTTWVNIYNVLSNLSDMELMAEEQGAPNYVGAAKIMKAINLALLVDAWNSVPYSDAFFVQTLKPTYDDGQQLYTEIFTLLTDGIANLQQTTTTLIMGEDDFVFGGNLSQWIKVGHALRARYLNHLSKTSSYDPNAVLAAIANGLESNADDAKVTYTNEVRNPWGAVAINQAGLVLDGWISQQIVEAMDGTTFGVVDPRMEFMFSRTQHGTFRGTRNGAGRDPDVVDLRLDASTLVEGTFYADRTSPVLVMTFAEQKFIEAEAHLALDNKFAAYTAYLAGIRAHMDMLAVSAAERDAYINNPAVSVGEEDITLDLIMKEKYVALYLSPETWNDARRYDFNYADMTIPDQLNPDLNGQFSRRLQYPSSEFTTNSDNVPRVNLLDRIWWDQN
ncbi:Starch-binding associating with outer membrane [Parapedobacter composti]|uniref:Starch-binding associating with outer membrane n=2 Tax=Parapedobacter composti TaxID=623281 RepID=A0A1I1JBA4_9SPHI|nr:Starch-binding associating with outer membrane [Parapedobacter composti]